MNRVVHITLSDSSYAEQLIRCLRADPTFADCRILNGNGEELPKGVVNEVRVIDLEHLPQPLSNPAKTVLIASGVVDLEQVWEAGIVSVLRHSEPLEYVKLAILAAVLRPAKPLLPESRRP
jgi:hypothetical protein